MISTITIPFIPLLLALLITYTLHVAFADSDNPIVYGVIFPLVGFVVTYLIISGACALGGHCLPAITIQ